MQQAGITSACRKAAFLAQIAHESGGFQWVRELGNARYFAKYEGRKDLGNTQPGDGAKYKGRGFIQLTGRANYKRCGEALGLDLEGQPALVEQYDVAAQTACWFWTQAGCNLIADGNTTACMRTLTRKINGGLNGLAERLVYYARAKHVLESDESDENAG